MLAIGVRVRLRLDHSCSSCHAPEVDGRIGTITGVVTAESLAADNLRAIDPRDVFTLADFDGHVYGVDFDELDALDGELCTASELELQPAEVDLWRISRWGEIAGRETTHYVSSGRAQ